MTFPLRVTFRNISSSAALEGRIRRAAAKLERFSSQIIRCDVVVEAPHHQHHAQGAQFDFQLDIALPGRQLTIGHHNSRNPEHASVYVALRDAFRAARRQLQDYEQLRRGETKQHSQPQVELRE